MRKIAVINQKGGVGKTTTSVNLFHALALAGTSVTLVDMDPQGHLTAHLGHSSKGGVGVGDLLQMEDCSAESLLNVRDQVRLLPAGDKLGEVENQLYSEPAEQALKSFIDSISESTDLLVFDCPPASGHLIRYALSVVDEVLVPVASDYLALRGLSDLMTTLNKYSDELAKEFKQWIVVTRFHKNRRLSIEVREKLKQYFPKEMLATAIRETSALAECPGFGETIFEYQPRSNGATDYRALAEDFTIQRFAGD